MTTTTTITWPKRAERSHLLRLPQPGQPGQLEAVGQRGRGGPQQSLGPTDGLRHLHGGPRGGQRGHPGQEVLGVEDGEGREGARGHGGEGGRAVAA